MPQGQKADLTGKSFGRLRVEGLDGSLRGAQVWLCRCECGATTRQKSSNLTGGKSKSCGCGSTGRPSRILRPGDRFDQLTTVSIEPKAEGRRGVHWLCLCECGRTAIVPARALRGGQKSCGCLSRELEDWAGARFGRWTIVSRAEAGAAGKTLWSARCDCGTERVMALSSLRGGSGRKSCGCLARENSRLGKGEAGLNAVWSVYVASAKNRGLEWSLDRDTFRILTSSNCHYCGIAPTMVRRSARLLALKQCEWSAYTHNGIDRVDSAHGYVITNCVPCCKQCNIAKRDFSVRDFLGWAARIAAHQSLLTQPTPETAYNG